MTTPTFSQFLFSRDSLAAIFAATEALEVLRICNTRGMHIHENWLGFIPYGKLLVSSEPIWLAELFLTPQWYCLLEKQLLMYKYASFGVTEFFILLTEELCVTWKLV